MAIASIDRRVFSALAASHARLATVHADDPHAITLLETVQRMLDEASRRYRAAIEEEDREETEADVAIAARHEAFDDLGDAFRRMYAGLSAGVSLSIMQGDRKANLSNLRTLLSHITPGAFRTLSFAAALQTVRAGMVFFDAFVPEPGRAALRADVLRALETADEAYRATEREIGEATEARKILLMERRRAREVYVSAREIISAAMRIDGYPDRVNTLLPTVGTVLNRAARSAPSEDRPDQDDTPVPITEEPPPADDGVHEDFSRWIDGMGGPSDIAH